MADIHTFIHSVKLPVMPEVAHALIRTLNDDNAELLTVRDIITKDPALTTTLLRMANSALFGLSRTVTTLDNAMSVVGMAQIRARALGICMSQVFKVPAPIDRMEFWRYSMVCAGYAKFLAQKIGLDEQQAWLTAMMLRLGEVVLFMNKPDTNTSREPLPRTPGARWKQERALFGFDEGQITGEVARRWDFPEAMIEALSHCTDGLTSVGQSPLCAVVHLAALWADQSDNKASVTQAAIHACPQILDYLGLDAKTLAPEVPDPEGFNDISALLSP